MKQAIEMVKSINKKKNAIRNTKSKYLKRDFSRSIWSDMQELKEYCLYKSLDFDFLYSMIVR